MTSLRYFLALGVALFACSCGERRLPDQTTRRRVGAAEFVGFTGTYGDHAWLGIRYAAPPMGDDRFRAPKLIAPEPGAHAALAFGSVCPQLAHPFGYREASVGTPVGSEDCLFLNVYAPPMTAEQAKSARLPVMVWFHGGGNVVGHAGNHDGGNLARRKRVIVVTINYRLGPFGFFRHAGLRENVSPEDASGNFGILDQIASLQWVKRHISGFGGNPDSVTIFGESAGARDVINLMISPPAKGLFHRAIAQSGAAFFRDTQNAEAFANEGGHKNSSNEVLLRLVIADGTAKNETQARDALSKMSAAAIAEYLRKKPVNKLLTAYDRDEDEALISVPNVIGDGYVIPAEPALTMFARPDGYHHVPLMLGTNRDENKTFLLFNRKHAKRFTPLYMRLRDPDRYNALAQGMSRAWKVSGADAIAAAMASSGGEAYVYRFDWDEQPSLFGADLSMMVGAGHGIEIPFVFGHFDLGGTANWIFNADNAPGRAQLSDDMMGYWTTFARTGSPGRGRAGQQPQWETFKHSGAAPTFMVFDTDKGGGVHAAQGELDFEQVITSIDQDPRLRNQRERCAVFREMMRFVQMIPTERYATIGKAGCKEFPFDRDPWDR